MVLLFKFIIKTYYVCEIKKNTDYLIIFHGHSVICSTTCLVFDYDHSTQAYALVVLWYANCDCQVIARAKSSKPWKLRTLSPFWDLINSKSPRMALCCDPEAFSKQVTESRAKLSLEYIFFLIFFILTKFLKNKKSIVILLRKYLNFKFFVI